MNKENGESEGADWTISDAQIIDNDIYGCDIDSNNVQIKKIL